VLCAAHAVAQAPVDSVGKVTLKVLPETVSVGQPFELRLRAIAPRGRRAMAPAVPDTGGIVEPLDPAVVTRRGDTLMVRYRLLAWQPGVLTIPLGPVLMRRDSNDVSVPFDARVVVTSVLPADSANRIPKDPRTLFPVATRWWEKWWQWALGALLAATVAYLVWRWRTREPVVTPEIATPLSRAEAAFARLDARQLVTAGEGGRHVALAAEVLRQYLAELDPSLQLSLTNDELLAAAASVAGIAAASLAHVLHEVDAVRFSGVRVDDATARRVSGLARELVREVDRLRPSQQQRAA
jgi:hypothetical protein